MVEITIEGRIKTVKKLDTRTADLDKEEAIIVVESSRGPEKVTIRGTQFLLSGMNPKLPVEITIRTVQTTLKDDLEEKTSKPIEQILKPGPGKPLKVMKK